MTTEVQKKTRHFTLVGTSDILTHLEKLTRLEDYKPVAALLNSAPRDLSVGDCLWIFELITNWPLGDKVIPELLNLLTRHKLHTNLTIRRWIYASLDSDPLARYVVEKVYGVLNPDEIPDRNMHMTRFLADPFVSTRDRLWVLRNGDEHLSGYIYRLLHNVRPLTLDELAILLSKNYIYPSLFEAFKDLDTWSPTIFNTLVYPPTWSPVIYSVADLIENVPFEYITEPVVTHLINRQINTGEDLAPGLAAIYDYCPENITYAPIRAAFNSANSSIKNAWKSIPFSIIQQLDRDNAVFQTYGDVAAELYGNEFVDIPTDIKYDAPEMEPLTERGYLHIINFHKRPLTPQEEERFINTNSPTIVTKYFPQARTSIEWSKMLARVLDSAGRFNSPSMRQAALDFCPRSEVAELSMFLRDPSPEEIVQIGAKFGMTAEEFEYAAAEKAIELIRARNPHAISAQLDRLIVPHLATSCYSAIADAELENPGFDNYIFQIENNTSGAFCFTHRELAYYIGFRDAWYWKCSGVRGHPPVSDHESHPERRMPDVRIYTPYVLFYNVTVSVLDLIAIYLSPRPARNYVLVETGEELETVYSQVLFTPRSRNSTSASHCAEDASRMVYRVWQAGHSGD